MAFIGHGNLYMRIINAAVVFTLVFTVMLMIQRHGSSGADSRVGGSWYIWFIPFYFFFFGAFIIGCYLAYAKWVGLEGSNLYSIQTIFGWIGTPILLFAFVMVLAHELNQTGIWTGTKSLPTLMAACMYWIIVFWMGSYFCGTCSDNLFTDPPINADQRDWVYSAEDTHDDHEPRHPTRRRPRGDEVNVSVNVSQ